MFSFEFADFKLKPSILVVKLLNLHRLDRRDDRVKLKCTKSHKVCGELFSLSIGVRRALLAYHSKPWLPSNFGAPMMLSKNTREKKYAIFSEHPDKEYHHDKGKRSNKCVYRCLFPHSTFNPTLQKRIDHLKKCRKNIKK